MAKCIFTIEDKDGKVAMSVDYGDGVDKESPAHKTSLILSKWMADLMEMPEEAPKIILAAEEINQAKASQVAHLGKAPRIIHAHSTYLAD